MRLSLVLCSVVAATGSGCVGASVTIQGQTLHYQRVSGRFCDHCAGTQLVSVAAEGDGQTPVYVTLEFAACKYVHGQDVNREGGAHLTYGTLAADRGEIVCHAVSQERVDLSFSGTLPDGRRIEGRVSSALKFNAGYD